MARHGNPAINDVLHDAFGAASLCREWASLTTAFAFRVHSRLQELGVCRQRTWEWVSRSSRGAFSKRPSMRVNTRSTSVIRFGVSSSFVASHVAAIAVLCGRDNGIPCVCCTCAFLDRNIPRDVEIAGATKRTAALVSAQARR